MRRPSQLRQAALVGSLAAVLFGLLLAFALFLLLGREGRLGFAAWNAAGLAEGAVFVLAFASGLRWVRSSLRLPSPTLLSFGLVAPPPARRVAAEVPVVDASAAHQTLVESRLVIVRENGVPVGVAGLRRERIVPWDELVKVDGRVAVTDLRRVLAHEPLVVVTDGERVLGVVTQEMYLAGLWGTVR